MSTTSCPLCRSEACTTILKVPASPTSDSAIVDASSDTTCCNACGFAFNATGARGGERAFYSETYDLLANSEEAESMYDSAAGAVGINDEMADYLLSRADLKLGSKILDVGCGKGLMLRALRRRRPDLQLFGVEPSLNARRFSEKIAPEAQIYPMTLEESPLSAETFDAITCVNVYEHVPAPVTFAKNLRERLSEHGILFIAVPNLVHNPTDVVTFDHLSRFTPATFGSSLCRAGFDPFDICAPSRVPMWALARASGSAAIKVCATDEGNVSRAAADWFEACVKSLKHLSDTLAGERRLAVYGTGLLLPAAVALRAISKDRLVAVFDDNKHIWGATRLGREVEPLENIGRHGVTDILLSANPSYWKQMSRKVTALAPAVKVWPLPEPRL